MNAKPVKEFRYSGVRAAIWLNQTPAGVMYNVTVNRSYKEKDTGEWKDSGSFRDSDLPALAKAASDAHSWIFEKKACAQTTTIDAEAA